MRAYFLSFYGAGAGALLGLGFILWSSGSLELEGWGLAIFAMLIGAVIGGVVGSFAALIALLLRSATRLGRWPLAIITSVLTAALTALPELPSVLSDGVGLSPLGTLTAAVAGGGTLLTLLCAPRETLVRVRIRRATPELQPATSGD